MIRKVPAGVVAQFAQGGEFGFDLLEPRRHRAQQPLARFGRGDTARRARQKPQAEPLLEIADRLAQRGGRHAQLGGGAGEALLPGNGGEGGKIVEVLHGSIR